MRLSANETVDLFVQNAGQITSVKIYLNQFGIAELFLDYNNNREYEYEGMLRTEVSKKWLHVNNKELNLKTIAETCLNKRDITAQEVRQALELPIW